MLKLTGDDTPRPRLNVDFAHARAAFDRSVERARSLALIASRVGEGDR
ncbi:MAG: hypothetical protein JXA74_14075 [Anaerolineae bacterium]|nr:hypothetical protein [Anaerolineae bacterium]